MMHYLTFINSQWDRHTFLSWKGTVLSPEVLDCFRVTCQARPNKMAAYVNLHSTAFLRALRGALSSHGRSPRPSAGLRSVCVASPEDKKAAILESSAEYKFVERLIPPSRVPDPPKHAGRTPSGWCPPADTPQSLPYMIRRSRMHNVPVYTDLTSGNRKTTLIRKVEGDIWALEKDVKQYLKEVTGKELPTQVNEVTMTLKVKGHFDAELKEWLISKGFWPTSKTLQDCLSITPKGGQDYDRTICWCQQFKWIFL